MRVLVSKVGRKVEGGIGRKVIERGGIVDQTHRGGYRNFLWGGGRIRSLRQKICVLVNARTKRGKNF